MGKITGFLEFERNDRDYAPVEEGIRHWREFVLPLPEPETRRQAARCMNCGIPYCHTGCPVNNQIPDWNDLVYTGAWQEASRNLHSTNNFPEVTGRVCPAPCEASCTLNIDDNPVTIKTIECAIADRAFEAGWVVPEPPAVKTGKSVAIVGSGPAGLACAQQLARAGHDVHVYEKSAKPGGLLRYGIPDFKMEKHHVDRRVVQMEAEGVRFHCGVHVGVNHSAAEYVRGDVYTNTVESAFSLLKRGVMGTWHKVSAKHLPAYLDEMCFRFNNRKNPFLFRDTLTRLVNTSNLEYKELTAQVQDVA